MKYTHLYFKSCEWIHKNYSDEQVAKMQNKLALICKNHPNNRRHPFFFDLLRESLGKLVSWHIGKIQPFDSYGEPITIEEMQTAALQAIHESLAKYDATYDKHKSQSNKHNHFAKWCTRHIRYHLLRLKFKTIIKARQAEIPLSTECESEDGEYYDPMALEIDLRNNLYGHSSNLNKDFRDNLMQHEELELTLRNMKGFFSETEWAVFLEYINLGSQKTCNYKGGYADIQAGIQDQYDKLNPIEKMKTGLKNNISTKDIDNTLIRVRYKIDILKRDPQLDKRYPLLSRLSNKFSLDHTAVIAN